jgi:hypothetical protein
MRRQCEIFARVKLIRKSPPSKCVFRGKLTTHFKRSCPTISAQVVHAFRCDVVQPWPLSEIGGQDPEITGQVPKSVLTGGEVTLGNRW